MKTYRLRLYIALFIIVNIGCTHKYYNRNGDVFRLPNEKHDNKLVGTDSMLFNRFDLNTYQLGTTKSSRIKYILNEDLLALAKSTEKLLIIFYDPICPQTTKPLSIARYAKDNNINFILLSVVNEPARMEAWNRKYDIDNVYSYIIPSSNIDSAGFFMKKLNMITTLCKSCKAKYRDELIYVDYMISDNYGATILLDIEDKNYEVGQLISWINTVWGDKVEP